MTAAIPMEMNLPNGAGGHNTSYPDTDYEGLVDAQIEKAEAHNNLFRGKEITESWASLKARIAQGDFSDRMQTESNTRGFFRHMTGTTNDAF